MLVALAPPPAAAAQDSTTTKSPRRGRGLEFGIGLTTRVQAIADVRWGNPTAKVGYSLRLHASLNQISLLGGAYPTFQVMVRP